MSWRKTLAAITLIAAMGMLQGCQTFCDTFCAGQNGTTPSTRPGTPWMKPGVVKAERDGLLIGYFSTAPGDAATQNWILRRDVGLDIPMNANGELLLTYLDSTPMTVEQLCATYGPELIDDQGRPAWHWEAWGWRMQVGDCESP